MKTKIHWGIIGLGKIAHKFAQDLRQVPDAKLHAVASTDRERANAFAEQYHAQYAFGSYEAILNCPHLDVVYVATPHVLHHSVVMMCLRRRIPVLCEKPLAMNTKEVRKMIDTARQNYTFFMEAMWSQFVPAFRKTLELIQAGAIGRPLSIKADFCSKFTYNLESRAFNKELGGGALLDIGIYPVMLSLAVFGKPKTVQALATFGESGVDYSCATNFQYENGAIFMGHSSMMHNSRIEASIYGDKGVLHLPSRFHHPKTILWEKEDGSVETINMPFDGHGYQFEAAHVTHCLKTNELESPIMSHQFSLDLIGLLDAVRAEIGLVYPNHD
ncbi:MAG: Gfo/Idh/MocA family oxidoreductase [Saprospiraceae bacterium]|nr:Gfo/Idh/MocA family oxidoreductase [Saprospiraceae bacterium]